jgi:tRNA threonylcarbamoyladenosine biosynthesis protein TsaB
MALILNLETATSVCSVSLSEDGNILALNENLQSRSHAETLTILIEEVFRTSGFSLKDIKAVAVSMGPGSYTGLRIGVSTAKGLCLALDVPLIGINTLQIMACQVSEHYNKSSKLPILFCPMIDARRMEIYTASYDLNNKEKKTTTAVIVNADTLTEQLKKNTLILFGDGAEKCKPFYEKDPNAIFINDISPSAAQMGPLSTAAFRQSNFVNLAYFEPFYLKDFYSPPPNEKK